LSSHTSCALRCGSWGENFFLFIQNVAITTLYFGYSRGSFVSPAFLAVVVVYAALGTTLYLRMVPPFELPPPVCTPLGLKSCTITSESLAGGLPILLLLFSRLPQIYANFRQGHTGVLAMPTYALNTVGALARVFTILQELSDPMVLFGAASGFVQNFLILLQMGLYRKANGARAAAEKAALDKKGK